MRRITFKVEKGLIDRARLKAARENRTLNAVFRDWLEHYSRAVTGSQEYAQLMKDLRHIQSSGRFSRNEANAR